MNINVSTDRKIILNGEITEKSAMNAAETILKYNEEDHQLLDMGLRELLPIRLYINSYGGSVYDANCLIGVMNESVTPIHTYGLGAIMSAAVPIFLMGDIRRGTQFSRWMIHQISSWNTGSRQYQIEHIEETAFLEAAFDAIITKKSKIKKRQLDKVYKAKQDWFFGYPEAKELGIINASWK